MDDDITGKLSPRKENNKRRPYQAPGVSTPIANEPTYAMPPVPLKMPPVPIRNTPPQPPPPQQVRSLAQQSPPAQPPRPVPPRNRVLPPLRKRRRWPTWARILVTVGVLFFILVGGLLYYGYNYFENNIQLPLGKFFHPVSRDPNEPAVNTSNDGNIMGQSWNILLLGSDDDQKYIFPAVLTQVMMVVHIDTTNNSVAMVSIPRDSWVSVPEIGGMHKIDQAFFLGANQKVSFDDGVRIARLTIEKDYGIPIDRYAWVGLSGFASVIDTLGGVDIDVTHPIVDDNYPDDTGKNANPNDPYALKRLFIAPGPQHMNGLQALEYVRSRHADLVGDIGRTHRQQQVLEALKKKLNASNVVSHLQQLIADLQGKVYTDLSEQEVLSFANYARSISGSAIQRVTLGPGTGNQDYGDLSSVYDPSVGSNQDVVIPNCANIQPYINKVFALGDVQSCNVTGG